MFLNTKINLKGTVHQQKNMVGCVIDFLAFSAFKIIAPPRPTPLIFAKIFYMKGLT